MDYLIRAEEYAAVHGHDAFFKWVYTNHREYYGVVESVWLTLSYLYDRTVANQLQNQE